ncbi:hypothetical protein MUCCIDRAFT_165262 [Mucor lusitanicus CBS 277.49]|uniref:Carbohydrate esterase family 16 protein n=1 Tax=Mucor lusitanicus CBS 277.49 TaxID=747725 RepID=A0A168JM54_MUCCL|nr:hypothetical protein MUCCIDRAFT_165262 [Mucor lusitanicus CBS 277.49]
MLPTFLFAASSMSILAYLYSVLLIPTVMTATIANLQSDPNSTVFNGTAQVPLDIKCPFLSARTAPPQNVRDLRPDDFRIVMGLGDSVMAGFAAKGVQDNNFFNIKNLYENRGISFAMGGDDNTVTVPNIINYYSYNLVGSSKRDHIISNQICPDGQYRPKIDVLNAAQSGARSLNLNHQIDYILDYLDKVYKAVGMMRVQDIVVNTSNFTDYCQPIPGSNFIGHDHECECSHSAANLTIMSDLFPQYNQALQGVAQHFQSSVFEADQQFAVVYQPLLVDIFSFPIEAISNIDCFHPSTLAHKWLSKMLWKMMFMQPDQKQETLKFDANAPIFCPTDADRITTL